MHWWSIWQTQGTAAFRVLADDTDVFVLLMHFYNRGSLHAIWWWEQVQEGNMLLSKQLLRSMRASFKTCSCSDTSTLLVLWGIGKGNQVIKVLQSGKKHLKTLGLTTENDDSAILQSVAFIKSNMTVLRYLLWISKMAYYHRLISAPEWRVFTPPHPYPTSEAFKQHVLAGWRVPPPAW